ncbi:MAG: restriction endonuclease subunit S [Candidimonas sp.]|nr:restriction endonuclease subunit S [Candidimonas sp.]
MSHYKPYPAYKDSGVEWLGLVPEHWDVCKLSFRYSIELGKMLDEKRLTKTSLVPYLRNQDVQWGSINTQDLPEMDIHPEELERYTIRHGDLLVCEGGDVGRAAIWRGDNAAFGYQKALHRLRHRSVSADTAEFFYFSLLTAKQRGVFEESDSKATIAHLPAEKFRQYRFVFPPLPEQLCIAAQLDRETARIDALIEKKTRFIELLREKRQALITHAVTKGLDPNVKMKDSGVEWLGEVPEHWIVSPLKQLVRFRSGGTPSKDNLEFWNGDIPWASAKDLKQEVLADTIDHLHQSAIESGAASLVPSGSILVVVRGMILARLFPVVETLVPMAINQDLKALVPFEKLNSRYLAHLLRGSSAESLSRLEEAGHGTKALRMENWVSIELPVPPLREQLAIIEMLDIQTARLDSLADKTERSIDLLKERRSALITAAVTGQIDLREAV